MSALRQKRLARRNSASFSTIPAKSCNVMPPKPDNLSLDFVAVRTFCHQIATEQAPFENPDVCHNYIIIMNLISSSTDL